MRERREAERRWERQKKKQRKASITWKGMAISFVIILAASIVMTSFFFPILKIYGNSMEETLTQGDIVVSVANVQIKRQDIIAFYYQNKILIKRVIGCAGDWIDINQDGTIKINGEVLDEPYVWEVDKGLCNIELPYQVPDGKWFVMGDHRKVSADSRDSKIGCVASDQLIGKVLFRIWPLKKMEIV